MPVKQKRIYFIVIALCVLAIVWMGFNHHSYNETELGVCIMKETTGIPCPACGSTRSILAILEGDFNAALWYNPIGFFLLLNLFILPLWVSIDLLSKRNTFFSFILKVEQKLKQKKWAISLSTLIVINWVWNIMKGL